MESFTMPKINISFCVLNGMRVSKWWQFWRENQETASQTDEYRIQNSMIKVLLFQPAHPKWHELSFIPWKHLQPSNEQLNQWDYWSLERLSKWLLYHNTDYFFARKCHNWPKTAFEWKFVNMENKAPDSRSVLSDRLSETNVFGSLRNHPDFPVVLVGSIPRVENHSQTEQIHSKHNL